MLNFNKVLNMLEKVKNHKYRDDLYEDTVLKRGLDINRKEKDIINDILLIEVSQSYNF